VDYRCAGRDRTLARFVEGRERVFMASITTDYEVVIDEEPVGQGWFWVLLGAGILWLILSFFVLQFTYTSIAAIAALCGVVLFFAALTEFGFAFILPSWRWVHALLGVLFVFGGVWAFVYPGQTFGTLALLFGWYLLIKGSFDIVFAMMMHGIHLWWLGMVAGFAEIGLAFWCIGYPGRSAALLVLWIGLGALLRGISTLVAASRLHRAMREVV
jgi:uncharacterized membrane protein HdeD (DUF308 family)